MKFEGDHHRGTRRDEDKSQISCHNCQRKGHIKKECWRPGGGKEGQGPKQKKKARDQANKAEETPKEFDLAYMADGSFETPDQSSKDAWWLDSCANQHLCNNRDRCRSRDRHYSISGRWKNHPASYQGGSSHSKLQVEPIVDGPP